MTPTIGQAFPRKRHMQRITRVFSGEYSIQDPHACRVALACGHQQWSRKTHGLIQCITCCAASQRKNNANQT